MSEMDEKIVKATDDENEVRWYVVNTYAGHENRVKDNLEKRLETMGIQESLFRIFVAEEEEIVIKKNNKSEVKKVNMFPGYIFVQMKMTDQAWYVVRNTPGVTGFIGSSGGGAKPFPVSEDEMESILRRMGHGDQKVVVDFQVGDNVKILTGPFANMIGRISAMNDQTQIATVMTLLFGRETPNEISYGDLQKLEEE
ncbi:transcription termination/antitermination factor NusG [Bulleidia extructa W1219]|uniref:Transcription termination/antitermination protein NusG n=1 Tax=Bulleidia extructa W1219 TaxID=679192 RepID=D2MPP9_9FIRM|nr:transcription termination/antitermination protein NusG [Bulleidia extructa]EFC05469.1 transcription termination/antitermination factor NusG [Bulleidia extructa W1219]